VQLMEPAVLARISARHVDPGDTVEITLRSVDTETGETVFERVG
jgi:hypothetical protein